MKFLSLAAFGAGAALAASMAPSCKPHPLAPQFIGRSFAHRGLFNNRTICENSLEAFAFAVDNNYGIELDVQLTADGKVVVFHDDSLLRMCGVEKQVNSSTYRELASLTLGSTDQTIPLFKDVLALVDGRVPLIVELKSTADIAPLCLKTYDLLRKYDGPCCIESFNPLIVDWFRRNAPQIMRGQLATKMGKGGGLAAQANSYALSHLMYNFLSRPHFIAYDQRYRDSCALKLCRALGAFTVAWTVTKENYVKNAACYDAVIFEGFFPPAHITEPFSG